MCNLEPGLFKHILLASRGSSGHALFRTYGPMVTFHYRILSSFDIMSGFFLIYFWIKVKKSAWLVNEVQLVDIYVCCLHFCVIAYAWKRDLDLASLCLRAIRNNNSFSRIEIKLYVVGQESSKRLFWDSPMPLYPLYHTVMINIHEIKSFM
jgi:hypothetical protein